MRFLLPILLFVHASVFAQSIDVDHNHVRRYHGLTFGFGMNRLFPSTELNAIGYSQKFGYEHRVRLKNSSFSIIPHIFYSRDVNRSRPNNEMTLNSIQDKLGLELTTELRLTERFGITAGAFGSYTVKDQFRERYSRKEIYHVSSFDFKYPNLYSAGLSVGARYYSEMFTFFARVDYSGLSYYRSNYNHIDGSNQNHVLFEEGSKQGNVMIGLIWAWKAGKGRSGCNALFTNPK